MSGPGFHQHLSQRQTQQLVLAPQLRQSLKILQVAALDLRSVIQEELQNNPTLEELPMEGVSLDRNGEDEKTAAEGPGDTDPREELEFSKDFEVLSKLGEDWRDYMAQAGGAQPYTSQDAEKRQHFFDSLVSETSLQEHLMGQAELTNCPPKVLEAMRFLVGSLDDRGYLTAPPADIALMSGLALEDVQAARQVLRTFDPPGIGALNLEECLLYQLESTGRGESLAARIVRDNFELLTRRRIPDLARRLGVTVEQVQGAIEEIGTLDPSPGRRFADDSNRVVVPDVAIEKDGGKWVIHLNNDYIPRLRISNTYRDLIAKGKLSKEEREYLRERIRSGRFLINSIEKVARNIVYKEYSGINLRLRRKVFFLKLADIFLLGLSLFAF